MDRRDLLKRFGVGAIIAPIIGGVVERSASAELIEVPKVKPVELFSKIPGPVDLSDVVSAQIVLEMGDGQTRTLTLSKWPSFEPNVRGANTGKIGVMDSLAVGIDFFRVSNNSSPQCEYPIGRLSADAKLS